MTWESWKFAIWQNQSSSALCLHHFELQWVYCSIACGDVSHDDTFSFSFAFCAERAKAHCVNLQTQKDANATHGMTTTSLNPSTHYALKSPWILPRRKVRRKDARQHYFTPMWDVPIILFLACFKWQHPQLSISSSGRSCGKNIG